MAKRLYAKRYAKERPNFFKAGRPESPRRMIRTGRDRGARRKKFTLT